ncbi:MAG: tryptophan transporter [Peptoniphilus sp.]|nr:tryptophan transporter [Peptoniphilus sp.]MDY3119036.1 tryptophan transporter [Peptoniphilus sp.]
MNTKSLVEGAIFIALGTILHAVVPGFFNGMKPDFMLFCLIAYVIINPKPLPTLAMGVATGVLAALTTQFPGGQLPNIVDKIVSAFSVLAMVRLMPGEGSIKKAAIYFIATVISGAVFLGTAVVLVGLPGGAPFTAMFVAIVLPTAVMTAALGLVFERVIGIHYKRNRA